MSEEQKEPKCPLCMDTGFVEAEGGGPPPRARERRVCSCGQYLELLHSTIEDMKAYLGATGLELRISPGATMRAWTVHIHSVTECNVGVGQDEDLVIALRKGIQAAMRRTTPRTPSG